MTGRNPLTRTRLDDAALERMAHCLSLLPLGFQNLEDRVRKA